ncbi:MAG: lysoplasmalogenase [Anaerolineaceae bacterium]|nr:MAG: lysoplasmalogenase [Anaerolineaceae bacterium]
MIYLIAALIFAALTALATWKKNRGLEFAAKPAVLALLLIYLWITAGLNGALLWFALGMFFSLVGDVLLLWLDRMFLYGLVSFLLAQVAYVIGFSSPPSPVSMWGLLLAVILALGSARVLRRILSALAEKGNTRMRIPIIVYGLVITLMLLSAMLKLTDPLWGAGASLLVALGAFLFYLSDIVLAWLKFVTPIQNGRVINIGLYHLGQILIAAGVVVQLKP